MRRVEDIETAVDALTGEEYEQFPRWFLSRDWKAWDGEIEADAKAGRLDFLAREGRQAKEGSKLRDL